MRGIFSSNPAPAAVRVLLGGHLLLLVAAALVLGSGTAVDAVITALMAGFVIGGIAALIAAIVGEPAEPGPTTSREGRRHG